MIIGDSLKVLKYKQEALHPKSQIKRITKEYMNLGVARIHELLNSEHQEADFIPVYNMHPEGFLEDAIIPEWPSTFENSSSDSMLFDLGLLKRDKLPAHENLYYAFLSDDNIDLLSTHLDKQNVIPVISMESLRSKGAPISRRISWEKTAIDFQKDLAYGFTGEILSGYESWIVHLEFEGLIVKYEGIINLYFYPSLMEGDLTGFDDHLNDARESLAAGVLKNGLTNLQDLFEYVEYGKLVKEETLVKQLIPEITAEGFENWSIIDSICNDTQSNVTELANELVINGEQNLLGKTPYFKCEALLTIDRSEIESYRSITNLISDYVINTDTRPLSVAVFGFPGSGKSFGIKQIAKKLGSFKTFTFNLSQYTSLEELSHAFQEIRDVSIQGKELPLVFFDEFDSNFEGKDLGWLKFFLAPMQDGVFIEDGSERPIGRAVFIFAGGTCSTFEQFSNQHNDAFKNAKGPDFISRLKGYINVLGPNQTKASDHLYILRRAMLLRSLILRGASQLVNSNKEVNIDHNLLHALLTTEKYLHGARSMEFLIAMSPLHRAEKWTPTLLPTLEQMSIHVNADDFYNQIYMLSKCNLMAKNSHNMYIEEAHKNNWPVSPKVDVPWELLDDTFKESNINQVRYNLERFFDSKIAMRPKTEQSNFEFKDEDLLKLAIGEHVRWVNERVKNGWKYGESRNDELKLHPSIVAWDELSQAEKQKDIDVILKIPKLLGDIGFELYYKG